MNELTCNKHAHYFLWNSNSSSAYFSPLQGQRCKCGATEWDGDKEVWWKEENQVNVVVDGLTYVPITDFDEASEHIKALVDAMEWLRCAPFISPDEERDKARNALFAAKGWLDRHTEAE